MKKILLILTLILALLGTFLALNLKSRVEEKAQNSQTVLLEVPKGSSPSKVFQILKQNGIWSDDLAFRLTMKRLNPSLKAGWFEIPAGLTLPQVLDIIASGKVAVRRVTIPEGRASWEIPDYLKKAYPDLNETRWNKLVQDPKFARSLGVEANSLEGYLLPDTYPFPIDANEETILKQMVAANLKVRDEMQKKPGSMWNTLGSWHKVLTLASVVEEETPQ